MAKAPTSFLKKGGEFYSVEAAIKSIEQGAKEASKRCLFELSSTLAKNAMEDGADGKPGVPKLTGALGKSAFRRMSLFKQGKVDWITPYAVRRFFENKKNPHQRQWTEPAWNNHIDEYEEIMAEYLEDMSLG